ncbi:MmcQ/YjbR family DNA-binding protein [Paenibacillus sp. HB172176]|uniref:MmcQ/YjbR family DNA-binding protein n=1 Tax=Paenibacillus sp. HB172176 TaxID=2493690 RepID=UPI00143A267D|nr:MmcQ/YjbR family DNA-binding protein [Paenibacillus sp. HB172176]
MKTLEELKAYCLQHAGAKEDYPFGHEPLVMKVGGKMFAIISESSGSNESGGANRTTTESAHASISLKCEPHMAELLRMQYEAVAPGYHLNKKHWNTVQANGSVPDSELQEMIDHSYDLIVKSLTKKQRAEMF